MAIAPDPRSSLPKGFSVYLDLLRFGAALMVLLFHVKKLGVGPPAILRFIPDRGHDFVILFFVLSGYVIASAADRKRDKGLREFALDRMARVYSVAVPLLVLCTVLAVFFHNWFDPQRSWVNGVDHPYATLALNLVFMGQSWWLHMMPFMNDPYWSLCYEVMYYAAFGAVFFMRGGARWAALAFVLALAGPKVLLLMPCWLLGVAAYFWRDRWKPSRVTAAVCAVAVPVVVLALLHKFGFALAVRALIKAWFPQHYDALDFSNDFLVDYVAAAIAAFHLYAIRYVGLRWPQDLKSFITAGAAMSFTLYLFHMPLVFVVLNAFGIQSTSLLAFLVCAIGIPLACFGLSRVTESRRSVVRGWLDRLLPLGPQPRASSHAPGL